MKKVTIIIPVFNEAIAIDKNLATILEKIKAIETVELNVLVVDDGSIDNTLEKLQKLTEHYQNLNFICLNRHFGKEAAIHAGLKQTDGDAVIVMDSDLQHPPELIPAMIQIWQQNISVVEACKVSRGKESYISRLMSNGFYHLFKVLADIDISNHSDFKLLDKKVVEAYCALPERKRFFRGLIHWMGFSTAQIPFEVPERQYGVSTWSYLRLFKLSLTAITIFSSIPLQIITLLGILTFNISLILSTIALYHKYTGVAVSGFTTVILLILFIGSALMIALGIIGNYIAHIYHEVKQRPSYLINWDKSHIKQKVNTIFIQNNKE